MINGNPVISSSGACRSTAVGGGTAATTARGPGCRATRAALDRRVRAVEEDAYDMTTEEGR